MNIDVNNLHKDVALKLNDEVYFGKDNVTTVIQNNAALFESLDVEKIEESQLSYGYNRLGNPVKLGFEADLVNRIVLVDKVDYHRFKGIIAYDGTNYFGYQIQKNVPTIQGELTRVVTLVNGEETLVQGASRTDTGVHALNFTYHFDTLKNISSDKWFDLFEHKLPNDIQVKSIEEVHPLFHSRYDVFKKRYIYKINVGKQDPFKINYIWYTDDLDMDILQENVNQLIGTHNFKSFCKGEPDDSVRTIYQADVKRVDNDIYLIFEGNGFLRYMIRIIVKTLVDISQKKLALTIKDIIKEQSRVHTKNIAPACGLYLEQIKY